MRKPLSAFSVHAVLILYTALALFPIILVIMNSFKSKRAIFGSPDLLVEIVSPSSVRRDRYQKKDLYARFGVKEYWIGDAANQSLEILTLKDGQYDLHCSAAVKGKLTSVVLTGLEFDLADIH